MKKEWGSSSMHTLIGHIVQTKTGLGTDFISERPAGSYDSGDTLIRQCTKIKMHRNGNHGILTYVIVHVMNRADTHCLQSTYVGFLYFRRAEKMLRPSLISLLHLDEVMISHLQLDCNISLTFLYVFAGFLSNPSEMYYADITLRPKWTQNFLTKYLIR
jgi:hypothetical protein